MTRAISVLVAVVVLLAVGWFVGHRPVSMLEARVGELEAQLQTQSAELERRAVVAEARGYVWQARAELLLATHDVDRRNYGTAGERATRAHELLQRAATVPGMSLDLTEVRDMVDSAVGKIGAMEPGSRDILMRAASELGRILEKAGRA